MDLNSLIYGLGISGLFASRAFLPAFVSSVVLRYGNDFPFLKDIEFLQNVGGGEPTWFTNGYVILALGVLSLLEIGATKIPEAEEALENVNKYLKTGMVAATYLGFLSTADKSYIEGNLLVTQAGFMSNVWLVLTSATTYLCTSIRSGILEVLYEADEDDSLGLRNLIAWAEDAWAVIGFIWLILYPVVVLIIIGCLVGTAYLLKKYFEHREERAKVACESCGEKNFPCAPECHSCHTPFPRPVQVGFFGQSKKDRPVENLEQHRFRLVEKKRCPACGTRLEEKNPYQTCPACGHELFKDPAFARDYLSLVSGRFVPVMLICLGLSFIPFIGLVIGVIVYRVNLVAPFLRYIPLHRSFFIKWLVRLFFFILVALQLIPGVGAVVVPIMALISYRTYRRSFVRELAL